MKKTVFEYFLILTGSLMYALGTVLFIFPHALVMGGTSGVSVILESFLPFSPGTILLVINFALIILAFLVLGKSMGIKTLAGSVLTTVGIRVFEQFATQNAAVQNPYLSAILGAAILAIASGIMFYVDSSGGGTDVIALIIKKYKNIDIGKALLITDVLIVILGGILSSLTILLSSFTGLIIKTLGIDFVISTIKKFRK